MKQSSEQTEARVRSRWLRRQAAASASGRRGRMQVGGGVEARVESALGLREGGGRFDWRSYTTRQRLLWLEAGGSSTGVGVPAWTEASTRMLSAGIVSLYHPGSLLFCRHEPPVSTWPSAKIHHQISLRMVFVGSFQASLPYYRHIKCEAAGRNHYHGFSSNDGFDQTPFWLTMIQDIAQSLRSLALFLLEQPSQLKYIEWPSLESTAKTATLTLILVALLIVSLASVDSFLCYILAILVRKTA